MRIMRINNQTLTHDECTCTHTYTLEMVHMFNRIRDLASATEFVHY